MAGDTGHQKKLQEFLKNTFKIGAWKGKITRASYSGKIFKTKFQRSVINMVMKFWNHLPNSSST